MTESVAASAFNSGRTLKKEILNCSKEKRMRRASLVKERVESKGRINPEWDLEQSK